MSYDDLTIIDGELILTCTTCRRDFYFSWAVGVRVTSPADLPTTCPACVAEEAAEDEADAPIHEERDR